MEPISQFIMSSDYASPRNDDNKPISITVPSNVSVPAGGIWTANSDLTMGTINSSIRAQIGSSKDSNKKYVGLWTDRLRSGSTPSFSPATYDIFVVLSRLNSTTVRLTASIINPYGETLTGASDAEVFTADVATSLSLFQ